MHMIQLYTGIIEREREMVTDSRKLSTLPYTYQRYYLRARIESMQAYFLILKLINLNMN